MRDDYDLVVLGAGPAGLAAAWESALLHKRVLVLEAQPHAGGLCATVQRDGFSFDLGGHRIISKHHTLIDRLRSLPYAELQENTRKSVILLQGKRYLYPLEAHNLWQQFPRETALRAFRDYALSTVQNPFFSINDSFESWTRARFGNTLYELFFRPYTEKLWGCAAHELSSDWASQRISLLNLADVSLRLAGLRRGRARTYARRYLYPKRGMGSLFDALVQELQRNGVDFLWSTKLLSLQRNEDGAVRSLVLQQRDAIHSVRVKHLCSTIPLATLASHLEPTSEKVRSWSAQLHERGMRFLNLPLRGTSILGGATWAYVPDEPFVFTRLQEPTERSRAMAPEGHTSLMLEIPADPNSPLWNEDELALRDRLLPSLERLGFSLRDRLLPWCFSARTPHAYPIYRRGYRTARDALLHVVASANNVWSVGRQGLFRYLFMDTAMELGFAAAKAMHRSERPDHQRLLALDDNPSVHEASSVLG